MPCGTLDLNLETPQRKWSANRRDDAIQGVGGFAEVFAIHIDLQSEVDRSQKNRQSFASDLLARTQQRWYPPGEGRIAGFEVGKKYEFVNSVL